MQFGVHALRLVRHHRRRGGRAVAAGAAAGAGTQAAIFVPWAEIREARPTLLYWRQAVRLTCGEPAAGSITVWQQVWDAAGPLWEAARAAGSSRRRRAPTRRRPDDSQGGARPHAVSLRHGRTSRRAAAPPGAGGEDDRGDDRAVLPRPSRRRPRRARRRPLSRVRRTAGLRAPPSGEVPLRRRQAHLRLVRDALLQAGDARAGAGGHALQRAADAEAPPGAGRGPSGRRPQDAGRGRG